MLYKTRSTKTNENKQESKHDNFQFDVELVEYKKAKPVIEEESKNFDDESDVVEKPESTESEVILTH